MNRPRIERIKSPIFFQKLEPKHLLNITEIEDRMWDALQYGVTLGGGMSFYTLVPMRALVRLAIRLLEQSGGFDYWTLVCIEDAIRKGYYAKTGKSLGKRELRLDVGADGLGNRTRTVEVGS